MECVYYLTVCYGIAAHFNLGIVCGDCLVDPGQEFKSAQVSRCLHDLNNYNIKIMVYFKLTPSLVDLVKQARLEGLVGCQVYCDRQFISYQDLEQVVLKLQGELRQAREEKAKRDLELKRKEELLSTTDKETRKQLELMEFMRSTAGSMSQSGNGGPYSKLNKDELDGKLQELAKWERLDMKELVASAEIVFMDQHFCNDNLKQVTTQQSIARNQVDNESDDEINSDEEPFKPETFILRPEDVIAQNEASKKTLEECEKVFGEDPGQKKQREESNAVMLDEIRGRVERKKYQEMTKNLSPLDPSDDHDFKAKQEFRFTIAFGFGFITLMFLSFVCGYFMGKKVLGLSETQSLIMSLIIGVGTIILETVLFVIRMEKMDANARKSDLAKSKSL
ncbi:hypothetical protein FGO68_gene15614 [Halteria grandinella]|uniref:Uncharacterized protein n=1 Tax=Halteria grandinella TaxID=5974 RepID=A0A8J8NZ57_HALGN|nr:hypothetical protein FGO68_gene15614 [Halteria grandinella]